MTNEFKEIENKVLEVYNKVSPSFRELTTNEDIKINLSQRKAILNQLKLVPNYFNNKKVIEVGGGTGENSIFYALWGGDVTTIEPLEISCSRASKLFKSFDKDLTVINKSLFEIDPVIFKNFDIIIAEGVLHHTFDTIRALDIILKNMSVDSIIMIAIPEYHGWFKRYLQRELIRISSSNKEEILINSKKYFQEHLNNAVKYGLRSEESVIYDTFVNPQIRIEPLQKICDSFLSNNIYHISSYPSLENIFETQPWSKIKVNKFNYKYYFNFYKLLEKIWMCSGEENHISDLSNLESSLKRIERDHIKLLDLENKIKNMTFTGKDLLPIQKGYMGIGMNYFVGIKEETFK